MTSRDPQQGLFVLLEAAVAAGTFPGCVALVWRDGALLYHEAHGHFATHVDGPERFRGVTRSAVYDLASLTKVLCTTTLAAIAVSEGKVGLDHEVPAPWSAAWGEGPRATLGDLLAHSGGLAAHREYFAELGRRGPGERVLGLVTATPLAYPVGAQAVYSDLGFILLGDFLEQRGQARLDQQLEPWLQPLGLALSFLPLTGEKPLPVDCAQTRRESPARELLTGVVHDDTARAMLGVAGHAGLFGTARAVFNLAQLLLACYHGDHAAQRALRVSAATVQRFFAPILVPGLRTTWGLGWDHPDPHPPAGSDESTTSSAGRLWSRAGVGHLGFTGCSVWLDPALHAVAVLVSNRVCVATSAEAEQTKAGMRRLRPQLHDALMHSWQQPR